MMALLRQHFEALQQMHQHVTGTDLKGGFFGNFNKAKQAVKGSISQIQVINFGLKVLIVAYIFYVRTGFSKNKNFPKIKLYYPHKLIFNLKFCEIGNGLYRLSELILIVIFG